MGKHALLSASGASRWMSCPPSARLEEPIPDKTSEYAEEGTFAHEMGEVMLGFYIEGKAPGSLTKVLNRLKSKPYYSEDLRAYARGYADYVIERHNLAKKISADAVLDIERKLDFSKYVPEGFGTGDACVIYDGALEIIDLKYGKGIPVSAVNNPQMMLYGLGALDEYDLLYGIHTVIMTVYQPRLDNISDFIISANELRAWGENEVKPKAQLAWKGEGDFCSGEHCRWCKVKVQCKQRASDNLELAKYDFADPLLLSDEELIDIYRRLDALTSWAKDISEHVYSEALKGKKWEGFKLVEGRSNRKYTDEKQIENILRMKGYHDDKILNKKLKGITDMEKLLTKKVFGSLLGGFIEKPEGKPTLVAAVDPRPEMKSSAEKDFINEGEQIGYGEFN